MTAAQPGRPGGPDSTRPLRRSMSASAEAHDGLPPAGALGKTTERLRAAIAVPTRGPAAHSLTVAVRDRKVEGDTQSLAAAVPSGLHPQATENLLSARMASGAANVMTMPGSPPLCPRRSTPPPYRSASNHFIAPSVSRTDHTGERAATPLAGADTLAEPFAGKPQPRVQPSTYFEEYLSRAQPSKYFEEYLSRAQPSKYFEEYRSHAQPSKYFEEYRSHAQPSKYFEEYLWPFPPAEPPELSHLDAIPDIFDDDEDTSWGDGCSCASLDSSDVISEPEIPSDWSGDIHATVVCAKPDVPPLVTRLEEQAAQVDGRIGALGGTGDRQVKRKAVQMAQDAQFARALERQIRHK